MLRFLARLTLSLLGNAVGLVLAVVLLDDMTIDVSGFLFELVIFTAVFVICLPLIQKQAIRGSDVLAGGSALVATLVALIVTAWIGDGLQITGTTTWLLAAVIVWAGSLLAGLILPLLLFKRVLRGQRR